MILNYTSSRWFFDVFFFTVAPQWRTELGGTNDILAPFGNGTIIALEFAVCIQNRLL